MSMANIGTQEDYYFVGSPSADRLPIKHKKFEIINHIRSLLLLLNSGYF
jgi:hypothetical protein